MRFSIKQMKVGGALLVALAGMELYRGNAYIPVPGDRPTYAYGETMRPDGTPVQMGDKTTPERALAMLYKRAEGTYADGVKKCVTAPVSDAEFSALIHGAYNAGVQGMCSSPIVAKINAGDYEGACEAFIGWRETVKGKSCRIRANNCYGLVTRRELERDMCKGEV